MRLKPQLFSILFCLSFASFESQVLAQAVTPKSPTAQGIKTLLAANKDGGAAITVALIDSIKADPKIVETVLDAAAKASPALLASIAAAISQAIVEIAVTNPQAAEEIKKIVNAKAPALLKKLIAENLINSTTATASTDGSSSSVGDLGSSLSVSIPSKSTSPQ